MEIDRSERTAGVQHHVHFPQNGLPYVEETTVVERGIVRDHGGKACQGWESSIRKRIIRFASEKEYNAFYKRVNQ